MQSLVPLGDQAALAYFADEAAALRFACAVRSDNPPWLVDVVQAYASVAVFFDLDRTRFQDVSRYVRALHAGSSNQSLTVAGKLHRIPCCYELQLDLARIAEHTKLSNDEVIRLHCEAEYKVYAIGFCPGFPYLGYLPAALCGVPRLDKPRL